MFCFFKKYVKEASTPFKLSTYDNLMLLQKLLLTPQGTLIPTGYHTPKVITGSTVYDNPELVSIKIYFTISMLIYNLKHFVWLSLHIGWFRWSYIICLQLSCILTWITVANTYSKTKITFIYTSYRWVLKCTSQFSS